ncbi:uncharacterized protein LOC118646836 [Monomorium pharaonis]|uniref:uncharacterized protein LOC118646836 n=1 Tax=Monomorium pharaonis TaxID=307658 RepID=UPI001746063C|nr:uncharacterized protein LOC118646836 [Monomorium pharaonis]
MLARRLVALHLIDTCDILPNVSPSSKHFAQMRSRTLYSKPKANKRCRALYMNTTSVTYDFTWLACHLLAHSQNYAPRYNERRQICFENFVFRMLARRLVALHLIDTRDILPNVSPSSKHFAQMRSRTLYSKPKANIRCRALYMNTTSVTYDFTWLACHLLAHSQNYAPRYNERRQICFENFVFRMLARRLVALHLIDTRDILPNVSPSSKHFAQMRSRTLYSKPKANIRCRALYMNTTSVTYDFTWLACHLLAHSQNYAPRYNERTQICFENFVFRMLARRLVALHLIDTRDILPNISPSSKHFAQMRSRTLYSKPKANIRCRALYMNTTSVTYDFTWLACHLLAHSQNYAPRYNERRQICFENFVFRMLARRLVALHLIDTRDILPNVSPSSKHFAQMRSRTLYSKPKANIRCRALYMNTTSVTYDFTWLACHLLAHSQNYAPRYNERRQICFENFVFRMLARRLVALHLIDTRDILPNISPSSKHFAQMRSRTLYSKPKANIRCRALYMNTTSVTYDFTWLACHLLAHSQNYAPRYNERRQICFENFVFRMLTRRLVALHLIGTRDILPNVSSSSKHFAQMRSRTLYSKPKANKRCRALYMNTTSVTYDFTWLACHLLAHSQNYAPRYNERRQICFENFVFRMLTRRLVALHLIGTRDILPNVSPSSKHFVQMRSRTLCSKPKANIRCRALYMNTTSVTYDFTWLACHLLAHSQNYAPRYNERRQICFENFVFRMLARRLVALYLIGVSSKSLY